jgi:hypothetical protein
VAPFLKKMSYRADSTGKTQTSPGVATQVLISVRPKNICACTLILALLWNVSFVTAIFYLLANEIDVLLA